jgi:translation initiation factor IF-1
MSDGERPILFGAVIELRPNLACSVHLDSGEVVQARIPRRTARLMFRVVSGDRVRVEVCSRESFVVLGHERVRIEPATSADGPSSSL